MKLVTFLLSASLTLGHVVPGARRGLTKRAGQQVHNLDNEPEFEDFTTGNKTPKSRILTGVGPDEADNRWFDWDESCTDKDQRAKIVNTFRHVPALSAATSHHLDTLLGSLNNVGTSPNKDNQRYIFENDPAYAQMFLGHDNRIQYVKETFDLVATNAPKAAGARGGNKPGALRFICNADNHVLNGDESDPYCG